MTLSLWLLVAILYLYCCNAFTIIRVFTGPNSPACWSNMILRRVLRAAPLSDTQPWKQPVPASHAMPRSGCSRQLMKHCACSPPSVVTLPENNIEPHTQSGFCTHAVWFVFGAHDNRTCDAGIPPHQ